MPLALNVIQNIVFLRERAKKRANVLHFFDMTKYFLIFLHFLQIFQQNRLHNRITRHIRMHAIFCVLLR